MKVESVVGKCQRQKRQKEEQKDLKAYWLIFFHKQFKLQQEKSKKFWQEITS